MSSKKQIIAVDIDDVLSSYADDLIKFSNRRWGTNLSLNDVHEDWAIMWKIDHKDLTPRANTLHKELFKNLSHREEAMPVLKKLSTRYELVITTSRQEKLRNDTQKWLDLYFPDIFKKLHFAGIYDSYEPHRHKLTKRELIEEIGADYLIDDQPKHCVSVAEAGREALLFGNYPWSQKVTLPSGVTRVAGWEEVETYFERTRQ